MFARKGGRLHVQAGRVYTYCAYVVTLSAITASAGRITAYQVQGIGFADRPDLYGFAFFLGYLGVVTFATVRQAMRVVATRRAPRTLRTPFHEALGWASVAGSVAVVAVAFATWTDVSPVLLGLSPIGVIIGSGMLRLMRDPQPRHMAWFYSHGRRDAGVSHRKGRRRRLLAGHACER